DFDSDGYADFVVANANGVQVFNGSAATLPAGATYDFPPQGTGTVVCGGGNQASGVNLGDVNGDGVSDLGVLQCPPGGGSLAVYVRNGDPAGLRPLANVTGAVSQATFAVPVGDINGDGLADLAFAMPAASRARVWLGSSGGTFDYNQGFTLIAD